MAHGAGNPRGASGRNWRRTWRRAPPRARRQAAAALGDVFRRGRLSGRGRLALLLVAAAAVHGGLLALHRPARPKDLLAFAGEDSYLRRVLQAERARHVARRLSRRPRMPPPPPVPAEAVGETLAAEIATDVRRVVGGTLDVEVTDQLARQVSASLREELAAAARSIADGELSAEEIQALREKFTRQAHRTMVSALRTHREQTQVARAKVSVQQWYEQRVSDVLRRRMSFELFGRQWGRGRAWAYFHHGEWDFLHPDTLGWKLDRLRELCGGQHYSPDSGVSGRPTEHGRRMLPDWPEPTAAGAEGLQTVLRTIHDAHPQGHHPSWDGILAAYVEDYYPHREQFAAERAGEMADLWARLLEQAEAYVRTARAGEPLPQRRSAQEACFRTLRDLRDRTERLRLDRSRAVQFETVNRAVRSRLLGGPQRERMYRRLVDAVVGRLAPAVRDLAANEFREGIIIRRDGIDRITEEFVSQSVAMLRRDVERALPKGRFEELVFLSRLGPYRSEVDGGLRAPREQEVRREQQAMAAVVAAWDAADRTYPDRRTEVLGRDFARATDRVVEELTGRLLEEGRFRRDFYAAVESVDYTDTVQQRLDARRRALAGRGQDLARLTPQGVPDTSVPMIALLLGASRGHGAPLTPVAAPPVPQHVAGSDWRALLRPAAARMPPPPASWGRATQAEVRPPFDHIRAEAIPFLANFPRLDGDLTDWGAIRPLITQPVRWQRSAAEAVAIFAAWNYQGLFFGYHVTQPAQAFAHPRMWYQYEEKAGVIPQTAPNYHWAYSGDYLRLLIDTLDARGPYRGEPFTQEFVILPRGTARHPNIPGIERLIASTRDVIRHESTMDRAVKSETRIFPPQPSIDQGPDGTGPFRVTRFTSDGYTTEIFLPRSLFHVPVFCPGWWIGFEAVVGVGRQPNYNCAVHGRIWANRIWHGHGDLGAKDYPSHWGDLLLLGTDPRIALQHADETGTVARGVVPGHSYLLTVIDPDRNIRLTAPDTVVVSAEVAGGAPGAGSDVEIYVLSETAPNTSVFRGYVDTQPGGGRKVHGVLELLPGQQLRFGYVDLANAEGTRNVIYHLDLPVLAGVTHTLAAAP